MSKSTSIVIVFCVLTIVLGIVVACSDNVKPANENIPENEAAQWTLLGRLPNNESGVYFARYIDSAAGVVCWVTRDGRAGGISCLPLSQTTLR